WPKPSAKVEMLAKVLSDEHGGTRRAAIDGLLKLKDPSSVPALVQRVADPKWCGEPGYCSTPPVEYDPTLRDDALKLLQELAPAEANPALHAALKCKDGAIRAWALRRLVERKDKAVVADLIRLLADDHDLTRRAAM